MSGTKMNKQKIVISLFDFTCQGVKPWAEQGYLCYCVDVQHSAGEHRDGNIIRVGADAKSWKLPTGDIVFAAFYPPCTDVAVSGAAHFKNKGLSYLIDALQLFEASIRIAELCGAPYFIENPVSTVSTYWRQPDHTFHPSDYGGYLAEDDIHPEYPGYIQPRDAYPKKTCLWVGNGFVMPPKKPVALDSDNFLQPYYPSSQVISYSQQHMKLGGKSIKTKNIRSATPRGFSRAVYESNKQDSNAKAQSVGFA
jgi:hypothetical protein